MEVLCGFTDGEHEIRKPKHTWTDDDSEPVWITDTEARKVIATLLEILEQENGILKSEFEMAHRKVACQGQMSRKFVYLRRMKDLREFEAQHKTTVSESATDDQKLRMHSELKAMYLADETRLWSMKLFDQQAVHLHCVIEMHVRGGESDKISRQCSDDEGCWYTDLVESENVFDKLTFKLCDPESNLRDLKIKCTLPQNFFMQN